MKAKPRTVLAVGLGILSITIPSTSPVDSPAQMAAPLQPEAQSEAFGWVEQAQAWDEGLEPPPVVLHNTTAELTERVEWALSRFETADLALPPLDITFHTTGSGCHGHTGYFQVESGVADIEVCMPTRHIILHELAHAWAAVAVNELTRAEVLRYWELETWNDQGAEWSMRASERAADTIAFALNSIPSHPQVSLLKYLCGYPLLTGHPLPGPGPGIDADATDAAAMWVVDRCPYRTTY